MGKSCIAFACTNNTAKKLQGISFHKFPKNEALRKTWIINTGRKNLPSEPCLILCSEHFDSNCFEITSSMKSSLLGTQNRRFLKADAVPTLFCHKQQSQCRTNTTKRLQQRKRKELVDELLTEPDANGPTTSRGKRGLFVPEPSVALVADGPTIPVVVDEVLSVMADEVMPVIADEMFPVVPEILPVVEEITIPVVEDDDDYQYESSEASTEDSDMESECEDSESWNPKCFIVYE